MKVVGTCDPDGVCPETEGGACPADTVTSAGTVCRADTGACDVEEVCSGNADEACPVDGFEPAGTTCTCSAGSGVCDGNSVCTVNTFIDIKPGSDPNSINPKKKGVVPVAILGSDTFDIQNIDVTTITFGPDNAIPIHMALEDVNDDSFTDLILQFIQKETGIGCGDIEAMLTGELLDGTPIEGTDSVNVIPCK